MSIRQENNFDLIRLLAASFVIFSHAFGICGLKDPVLVFTGSIPGGQLAVYVFFIISGYLITASWIKRPQPAPFFEKRILRIFPALIVVLFLSVFLFGPILTSLPLKDYFTNTRTYTYFLNLTLIKMQFHLPGVMHNGHEIFFNYPLWTLFFEFLMYVSVAFLGLIGILKTDSKNVWLIWIAFIAFIGIDIYGVPKDLYILKVSAYNFTRFFICFYAGVLYYLHFRERRPDGIFVLLLIGLAVLTRGSIFFMLFALIATTVTVFWFAFMKYRPLQFIVSEGDFSYGIYIYGSIVQNFIMIYLDCTLPLIVQIVLSLVLTFPFAYFSWKLIESKAMKLKLRL